MTSEKKGNLCTKFNSLLSMPTSRSSFIYIQQYYICCPFAPPSQYALFRYYSSNPNPHPSSIPTSLATPISVDLSPPPFFPLRCSFSLPGGPGPRKLEFEPRPPHEMATCVVTETICSSRCFFTTPFLAIDPLPPPTPKDSSRQLVDEIAALIPRDAQTKLSTAKVESCL